MLKNDNLRHKSKNIASIRLLFRFFKPYRKSFIKAVAAIMVGTISMLAMVQALRYMVDGIGAQTPNYQALTAAYFAVLVLAIFMAVMSYSRVVNLTVVGEGVVADVRRKAYQNLLAQSLMFFDEKRTGELVSRLVADAGILRQTFEVSLPIALRSGMQLIGGLVLMLASSFKLSFAVLLILPVVLVVALVFGKRVRKLSHQTQEALSFLGVQAETTLSSIRTVKAFSREAFEGMRFDSYVNKGLALTDERAKARGAFFAVVLIAMLNAVAAVLWLGGRDVMTEVMSAGELTAFLVYAVMVGMALGSLAEVWASLQLAAGASERLFDLIQTRHELAEPASPKVLAQAKKGRDVTVENLTFTYPEQEKPVLDNVSFTVKAGEMVAIVGPSGSGKSSLLHLLMRFADPQTGKVSIDNVSLPALGSAQVRKHIGLVAQDAAIFNASAYDNILYGNLEATEQEVHQAAKLAQATEFIEKLPKGWQTMLGERGVKLSGGQRQRIAIARTLLKSPDILLLDEATSHLDAASEHKFQQALEHVRTNRTLIVVAHRLSTVQSADRIIVLEDGKMVAEGTHKELLQKNQLYKSLAELQFVDH